MFLDYLPTPFEGFVLVKVKPAITSMTTDSGIELRSDRLPTARVGKPLKGYGGDFELTHEVLYRESVCVFTFTGDGEEYAIVESSDLLCHLPK